jgi:RNA polymerase sigma-70 factor (ECF subfamily)
MNSFPQQLVELLPRLRRFARALTRSEADADDLSQAVVERALLHAASWRAGTRLDSWLFRIAQNLWRDELRAHRRRAEPLEEGNHIGEDGRVSFHRQLEVRDLARAFDDLPEDQRAVMALVVLEGMQYSEAAHTLGLPVGTVMSRLARARSRLAAVVSGESRRLHAAK